VVVDKDWLRNEFLVLGLEDFVNKKLILVPKAAA
jgi:hypothetical protein